jgi:large subunit ribosomal protein L17
MRHRVAHRKLGRVTEHRIALLRNQAQALLRHERIETTVPKARELRPFVERLITIAKRSLKEGVNGSGARGGDAAAAADASAKASAAKAAKGRAAKTPAGKANAAKAAAGAAKVSAELTPEKLRAVRILHAKRLVGADLHNPAVVTKLFDTIAPRFATREGGYTRLLRVGNRRGDYAQVAQVELVGSEYNPNLDKTAEESAAPVKAKGVRGRLQAAASRLRGKKADDESAAEGGDEAKSKKSSTAARKKATKKTKDD